ncbi:transcription factor [Mycena floridula]|nr:transcription factor [Mycena floridula]
MSTTQQTAPKPAPATQLPVKIYNAVYSSVQVYECMIRSIAVMRRRGDSYVNATQILKVAGVDKGRRTKILEKEILPGKHEIVQGGYGKYQGTWIPLERGRDIALQYGVAPLLAPLFDFTPSTSSLAALPVSTPHSRPLSAAATYPSLSSGSGYMGQMPSSLAPPPIMPGSALRLLNQGRAQGLFTPSTSSLAAMGRQTLTPSNSWHSQYSSQASHTPPPVQPLKRHRSETDVEVSAATTTTNTDVQMVDGPVHNGPAIVAPDDGPSPAKRARKDPTPPPIQPLANNSRPASAAATAATSSKPVKPSVDPERPPPRMSTKPSIPRNLDPTIPLKDTRRAGVVASICHGDDPTPVLNSLREIASLPNQSHLMNPLAPKSPPSFDIDTILDDHGHTALHMAASLSRLTTVQTLISQGADLHRGNHLGETPLMRTILSTHSFEAQSLQTLLQAGLSQSILTLDTSKKSVLHHIVLLAGVKGRSIIARYYLDQIFYWIANEAGGDFGRIVDLQDEHGDTALNIAARVGSRTLVRTLVDVGANKLLMNKLGLRPGDFGVESEELNGGPKTEDIIAVLRTVPPIPVQKSQDVIADMTTMIQGLSSDFQSEIKSKHDALDVTQAHLRAATRELSEQRKQIQTWQARCAELDMLSQRVKNVEKAIKDEDMFDWTGRWKRSEDAEDEVPVELRVEKDKQASVQPPAVAMRMEEEEEDADASADDDDEAAAPVVATTDIPMQTDPSPPLAPVESTKSSAFRYRGPSSTLIGMTSNSSFAYEPEPPIPTTNDIATLIRLRRMKMWHLRMEELVSERLKGLQGASAEKEYMCRKIVSLCTGVPVDKVEDMLENLVVAVESESVVVDIGRVSGFMQKVRDGVI